MEELRVEDEDEVQLDLKEIVWAKIIGYPRWPARITQIPSARNPYYRVDFFNDHTQYNLCYAVPSFPPAKSTNTRTCANISICIAI